MNPTTSAIPAPPGLVHDVKPPVPQKPAAPAAITAPIKAEVVDSIPVKQPTLTSASQPVYETEPVNPVASVSAAISDSAPQEAKSDNDLDRILKSVNRRVKATDEYERQQTSKKRLPLVKLEYWLVVPVAIAVVIAATLLAAAVLSFRSTDGQTGASPNVKSVKIHIDGSQ